MTENEQRLIDALEYINPDDYDTWLKVGMALKHEGLPLAIWEGWSRRSAKHRDGECSPKWDSFREGNAGQPVTGGTIVALARQNGYTGRASAGSVTWRAAQPTQRPTPAAVETLPTGYKPETVPDVPADYDPAADMKRYLSLLFRPDELITYCDRLTKQTDKNGKPRFAPVQSTRHRTAREIIDALAGGVTAAGICAQSEGGAFVRFNPMDGSGDSDKNVVDFRFCLIESDTDAIEKQYGLYKALRLPIAVLVHSGNKSLHAITRVDAQNAKEYSDRVRYIYEYCERHGLHVDKQDRNASRYSRLPGIKRGDRWQYIVDANLGAESFAEWAAWAAVQPDPTDRHGPSDGGGFDWNDEISPDGQIVAPAAASSTQPSAGTTGNAAPGDGSAQPQTAHELFTVSIGDFVKNTKPLEWLVYGYIQKNALEMCFGPSQSGKSFVILDMALHVAVKQMMEEAADANDLHVPPELIPPENVELLKHWHGQVTHGGRVLYVAGEGVTGLRKRALGWLQHYNINPDNVNEYFRFSPLGTPLDEEDPLTHTGGWPALLAELETLRAQLNFTPDLIIFDTLNQNMRGEENSAKESGVVIQHAQRLVKDYKCTVIFIHHTGLSAVAKDRARGSSAWRGAMDIEFSVKHAQSAEPPELICGVAPSHTQYMHYAVIDVTKCKDAEPQEQKYLKRTVVDLEKPDGSGHMYSENGNRETTIILETQTEHPTGLKYDDQLPPTGLQDHQTTTTPNSTGGASGSGSQGGADQFETAPII